MLKKILFILDPREPFMVGMTLCFGISLTIGGFCLADEKDFWWVRLLVGFVLLIPAGFYACVGLRRRYQARARRG